PLASPKDEFRAWCAARLTLKDDPLRAELDGRPSQGPRPRSTGAGQHLSQPLQLGKRHRARRSTRRRDRLDEDAQGELVRQPAPGGAVDGDVAQSVDAVVTSLGAAKC